LRLRTGPAGAPKQHWRLADHGRVFLDVPGQSKFVRCIERVQGKCLRQRGATKISEEGI
jgi:hypothetical protein